MSARCFLSRRPQFTKLLEKQAMFELQILDGKPNEMTVLASVMTLYKKYVLRTVTSTVYRNVC